MRSVLTVVGAVVAAACLAMPVVAQDPPTVTLVRDIKAVGGSGPQGLTAAAGLLFFSASDGTHGRELWVSDGTEAGTTMVRDIDPGAASSDPRRLVKVGSRVFFSASDADHGRELWVSDGTKAGTRLVKDLTKGPKGSAISGIAGAAGTAYFVLGQRDLWRSDGTSQGTAPLRSFMGVTLAEAVGLGSTLYFSADGLWRTKGTPQSTRRVTPVGAHADQLVRFDGKVYFRYIGDSGYGAEPPAQLWRSNGTKSGTVAVGEVLDPFDLAVMGDRLYFNGRTSGKDRLFGSDGTTAGTLPVKPLVAPVPGMVTAAGQLWGIDESDDAWGEPDSLWGSDGTAAGTQLLYGGTEEWFVANWRGLDGAGLGGALWFSAGPGDLIGTDTWELTDQELWTSDGTPAGTVVAADVNPSGSSFPRQFVRQGQTVYFVADDGTHGRELWSVTQD